MVFFLLLPDHQWQERIIPNEGANHIMMQSIGDLSIPHHLSGSLARDNIKSTINLEHYLKRSSDILEDPEHRIKVSIQPAPLVIR